ncbi:hypothetical protein KKB69_02220 [Patescibacteria group bacterium]|nr:hypothetical protein [Patescibacteria group bacterium]
MRKIILALFILIIAGAAGYYIYHDLKNPNVRSSTSINLDVPDLDRPINMPETLPEDAQKIAREKIEKITADLKNNQDLFASWLELGVYRKMIDDFEGAKEVWEYASLIRPENSISFNNLGDLYGYYLKDNKKAEENFLKALENGSDKVYIYRNAFDFYYLVMKDEVRAKQILEKGIELNPESSQDLKNLLDGL